MKISSITILYFLSFSSPSFSQRPSNVSICDYYAATLFGANTAANQQKLMTHITNTAIIGNYTTPNNGLSVAGIAPVSVYNGTSVNLLSYFIPALNSTNDGVTPHGVPKLFLDDGGAVPLAQSLASNGNTSSAQFNLVTHVWQYFGLLLNCSLQGSSADFPAYGGRKSMYEVHKFMFSTPFEQGWFVHELADAAKSLGFSDADTTIWFNIMTGFFSYRCAPPTSIAPGQAPQLQSICVAPDCPLHPQANCSLYDNLSPPAVYNASLAGNYTKLEQYGGSVNGTSVTTSSASGASTATKSPTATAATATGEAVRSYGLNMVELLGALAFAFVL